jgi:hypothetical protein
MLVITGKAAEMVEEFEKEKKRFGVDNFPMPVLTDEEVVSIYKLVDFLKTFPLLIDIVIAVTVTASLKLTLGPKEIINYITKLQKASIE